MTDALDEELRDLRRRAYGPDADIAADPAALDRLRRLEQRTPAAVEPPPAEPTATETDSGASSPAAGSDDGDARHPPRRPSWRIVAVVFAAFVVGAVLAVVAAGVLRPDANGTRIGVLAEDPDFTWPEFLGTAQGEGRGFERFHGLTVMASSGWSGPGTDECLVVMGTDDMGDTAPSSTAIYWSCGTAEYPAVVQFRVTAGMPNELTDRFPVDTSLRFVLADAQVEVYTRR